MNARFLLTALLCASLAVTATAATKDLPKVTLAFRYNTQADDGKNYVRWESDGTKKRDRFDATTGASTARATQALSGIVTSGKTKLAPKGLRALLLFAVSAADAADTDALTITQDGRRLTIQFVHRGVAYRIESDKRGRLDVATAFSFAENVAENKRGVFTIPREFLPGGKPPKPEPQGDEEAGAESTGADKANAAENGDDAAKAADSTTAADTEKSPAPASDGTPPADAAHNAAESATDGDSATATTAGGDNAATASGATSAPNSADTGTASTAQASADGASSGNSDSSADGSATESEYVPPPYDGDATDMHNLAWENLDLLPDCADSKASKVYKGTLRATYKNGVLTLRGTLKSADAPESE